MGTGGVVVELGLADYSIAVALSEQINAVFDAFNYILSQVLNKDSVFSFFSHVQRLVSGRVLQQIKNLFIVDLKEAAEDRHWLRAVKRLEEVKDRVRDYSAFGQVDSGLGFDRSGDAVLVVDLWSWVVVFPLSSEHCECLAGTGLAVSQNCTIEAVGYL